MSIGLKERAGKLKGDIPAVYLALKKKETPWYAKAVALLTIVYALSPIDLIPDFIPVLGLLDDLIILPLLVTATVKLVPRRVFEQCRAEAAEIWKNGKPKRWYYAAPFVLFWLIIAALLIKAFI